MGKSSTDTDAHKSTLLEKILVWSESSLTEWQRDAARRLFLADDTDLKPTDYDELYALLKAGKGIAVKGVGTPEPLATHHLPATSAAVQDVTIKALRELKHVNRIPSGQALHFSPTGMTIIYGMNGSGKSGYSRVMKRACRSRDQSEPIHPDATDPPAPGTVAEAIFDVEVGGTPNSIHWQLGDTSPEPLGTVAVFDGRCARVYLTAENDVAYLPYGLDVVKGLAQKVLPQLERMLNNEIASLNTDTSALQSLHGPTKVGSLIETLSAKTDEGMIIQLGTVNESEKQELERLRKTLAETDPQAKAKQLRLSAQRMSSLLERMESVARTVDDSTIKMVRELDQAAVAAADAARLAAEAFRAGESLLPGTGDDAWKDLFEAARRYSIEVAYPDHPFPHTSEGAVCPLCQQELTAACERMERFDTFVKQDAAKKATATRTAADGAIAPYRSGKLSIQLDEAMETELGALDDALPASVKNYESWLNARRSCVVRSATSHAWDDPPPKLEENPRPKIQKFKNDMLTAAEGLEGAADEDKRKALEVERNELQARVNLSGCVAAVQTLLANIKLKASLEACRKELKTTAISNKAKAFASEGVTEALKKALDREFDALGVGHISTTLSERTDKGKMKHRLLLDLPAVNKLDEILSEGEQRAIAIGAFLAELELAEHTGAVVFDDPVSSLDHQRKGKIAKRLAELAGNRQIIVLTHDLVFLGMLVEQLDAKKSTYVAHWLERNAAGQPGWVKENDSPAGNKAYRKTVRAQESMKKAEGLDGDERVTVIRQGMGELRRVLEEIVPQYLFKDVIARWRERLMLANVPKINWDNATADEIDAIGGELSRHIEGHSHSDEYIGGVPELDDLKELIKRVDAVIEKVKKGRTES